MRAVRAGIGFVFQQFNLAAGCRSLPTFSPGCSAESVVENLPGGSHKGKWPRVLGPGQVGIADCAWQRTSTLSEDSSSAPPLHAVSCSRLRSSWPTNPSPHSILNPLATSWKSSLASAGNGVTVLVSLHQVGGAGALPSAVALHHGRVVYDGLSGTSALRCCVVFTGLRRMRFSTAMRLRIGSREARPGSQVAEALG